MSEYSTTSHKPIHESSKRMMSEPTHLIKDPNVNDIFILLYMTLYHYK